MQQHLRSRPWAADRELSYTSGPPTLLPAAKAARRQLDMATQATAGRGGGGGGGGGQQVRVWPAVCLLRRELK